MVDLSIFAGIGLMATLLALIFIILLGYTLYRQASKGQTVWYIFSFLFSPVIILYWILNLLGIVK